jgi:nicotinamide-nucleotide amidase
VGLVFIGLARQGAATEVRRCVFPGDRAEVRAATVAEALGMAARALG